jgi:hypothetical protein
MMRNSFREGYRAVWWLPEPGVAEAPVGEADEEEMEVEWVEWVTVEGDEEGDEEEGLGASPLNAGVPRSFISALISARLSATGTLGRSLMAQITSRSS